MTERNDLKKISYDDYIKQYLIERDKYNLLRLFKNSKRFKKVVGARFFPFELPNRNPKQVSNKIWLRLITNHLNKENYN